MEILCADITDLQDALFRSMDHIDQILDFWMKPGDMDHFRAGYVNRVVSAFLTKRKGETVALLRRKPGFLASCLAHLDNSHVADLLLKILASNDAEVSTISVRIL